MGQSNKFSNYSFDKEINGDIDYDPDFDLDEYIRQKSDPHTGSSRQSSVADEKENSQFKNAVLIFMVFAAAFLWMNDWSISQAWNGVFGNEEVTSSAPSFGVQVPEINIPDIPAPPLPPATMSSQEGYVDYLASLNEAGYQDNFSSSQAIGLYNGGVTIEYLNRMNEAGYLDKFSYSAMIGLYNTGVTVEYLDALSEAGFLDDFSYSAIIGLYSTGVTIEYLNELSSRGYLENFSYSAIIALYNTDVTVEYLDQLNENGLLENMSYSDIIMAYNTDN
ncbi:MAG: hypothetical protein CL666_00860 [Balneola sp.]|mgnify:CR=1 FL=1|nr:hypothetical protein [Balneola sp.]|tara:strand:+ start:20488 stop:21318 length:831 start_codon:yes stop_codon:yes gene_type:complete